MIATRKLFTIDEYHRLIELGFLTEGDHIELIRGELIQMTAKGTPHTVSSSILCCQLDRLNLRYDFSYYLRAVT
jgi:Uma2 family endonuclease